MVGLSKSERKKLIDMVKDETTDESRSREYLVERAYATGCSRNTFENMLSEMVGFGWLERIIIRPSDGFNDALYGYKWKGA